MTLISILLSLSVTFFFSSYGAHRHLHSFPTRRSSDLADPPGAPESPQESTRGVDRFDADGIGILGPESTSPPTPPRSEEHTSELQSRRDLVCRLLLEKKKKIQK